MNTNNKEALELIKKVYSWYGFDEFEQFNRDALAKAAKLLKDNEDTEVKEAPRCGDINCNSTHCVKPSSKVEKLKAIKDRLSCMDGDHPLSLYLRDEIVRLINVIEDEE